MRERDRADFPHRISLHTMNSYSPLLSCKMLLSIPHTVKLEFYGFLTEGDADIFSSKVQICM